MLMFCPSQLPLFHFFSLPFSQVSSTARKGSCICLDVLQVWHKLSQLFSRICWAKMHRSSSSTAQKAWMWYNKIEMQRVSQILEMCFCYNISLSPVSLLICSPALSAPPSFFCCLFPSLLTVPFCSFSHNTSPVCILTRYLKPYVPFAHLELPCVESNKHLDFTCSPSPQAPGAKANVWLKS